MRKKIALAVFIASLVSLYCRETKSSGFKEGPLFIQVHYMNRITGITLQEALRVLEGRPGSMKDFPGREGKPRIYCDREIHEALKAKYPALTCTVESFKKALALGEIRPFLGISDVRGLMPHFRALAVDGILPWGRVNDDYTITPGIPYPLTLKGADEWNNDSAVTVVQTGVTAMTRGFMGTMNRLGDLTYPVKHTQKITSQADLATTSNEVSFYDNCRLPLKDGLTFCTPKSYFRILTDSGFDVIELTGNHNNDYGTKYNSESIDMIEKAGMRYFGGGKNTTDAEKILYLTVKGVKFAFIGFNQWGPKIAWATGTMPGAARLTKEKLLGAVREAAATADILFLSVQWGNENDPKPYAEQKEYFREAAALGATILVSSSAHRVMGLEFHQGRFISYGLGNFLFDQMHSIHYRRGVMARHHFYRGRHVQTELIPYMIHNYAQPVLLHGKEAQDLFDEIFRHSLGPEFR